MKKILLSTLLLLFAWQAFAAGILVKDAVAGEYLRLEELSLNIQILNQVAITSVVAKFINNTAIPGPTTYIFPLHEEASATNLSWLVNGQWYDAVVSPGAQGPVNPGGTTIHPFIDSYMGKSPLVFPIPQTLAVSDTLLIELQYVELLKYQNGEVHYSFPLDYRYLSNLPLSQMDCNILVGGGRNVTSFALPGFPDAQITLLDGEATASLHTVNQSPYLDIELSYTLAMQNLGAITFSSFVESDLVPDELGDGFFLSVIEPEPSVDVIQKYFTFVMDRSAQMSGSSIAQAKIAASYMVENLNAGDYFNIVDFNTMANTFALNHVPFNAANKALALSYISNLEATGMCNISAAFDTAIPQFANSPEHVANIIVFLSKGRPNVGILDPAALVNHVEAIVNATGRMLNIFCFGIGTDVDPIVLSQIAAAHGGSATWVGMSDLSDVLIDFYTKIRSPILLNPTLLIDQASGLVTEVYPVNIPNLYLGTQMLLCGRYSTGTTSLNFEIQGNALGSISTYQFKTDLSTEAVAENVFLMKIWAKMKIEHLMGLYDQLNPYSTQAVNLKQEIIDLSVAYGVLCRFTSFGSDDPDDPDDPDIGSEDIVEIQSPALFSLLGNYPNPFNPSTTICFELKQPTTQSFSLRIYNSRGQLVRTLRLDALSPGIYSFHWDGLDEKYQTLASGVYYYCISCGDEKQIGKMLLMK